jgi:hypothetical protein
MSCYAFTFAVSARATPPLYSANGEDEQELMSRAPLHALLWLQSLLLGTRKRIYYPTSDCTLRSGEERSSNEPGEASFCRVWGG